MNTQMMNTSLADFIWKNADDLWGNFKHADFGKVTRENRVVMAQIGKNTKDQAMKGNLPGAVQVAVVRAMSSHSELAALLLRKDRQALPILEDLIYEILNRGEALNLEAG